MTQLQDLRLRLLVQQESERLAESQPDEVRWVRSLGGAGPHPLLAGSANRGP